MDREFISRWLAKKSGLLGPEDELTAAPMEMPTPPAQEPAAFVPPPEEPLPARPRPVAPQMDTAGLEEADTDARRGEMMAGLGRAGQMFAQAFGAKNADPGYFDTLGQEARQRRDTVSKYLKDKAQKSAEQQNAYREKDYEDTSGTIKKRNETARTEAFQLYRDKSKDKTDKGATNQKLEVQLSQDYLTNQGTKAIQSAADSYAQIANAPEDGSADITMVYGMAKLLDPGGRVTDSDAEMQGKSGGLRDDLQRAYNSIVKGGILGPLAKQKMKAEADRIMAERVTTHAPLQQSFRDKATSYGLNPGMVVPDLGFKAPPKRLAVGPDGKVRIQLPDGQIKRVPADKVEEAIRDYGAQPL